jgi:DNA-binding transcriptional ArsR family regulator
VTDPTDQIFRALADPTRRLLLDRLRERSGQTLGELCDSVDMKRQSVTQHLDLLEAASLVATVRRGRQKLHYLNPVPIYEAQERWIGRFDTPRLRALSTIKHTAEGITAMTTSPDYVYVTYIRSSAETVWHALTDADLTADYWGHSNVSTWESGARWEHLRTDGSGIADVVGEVLEADPPRRLGHGAPPPTPADRA